MLNRRTFLGSMAGASAAAISAKGHRVVSACEQFERAKIADVRVIRLRDKNGSSKIRNPPQQFYDALEKTTEFIAKHLHGQSK